MSHCLTARPFQNEIYIYTGHVYLSHRRGSNEKGNGYKYIYIFIYLYTGNTPLSAFFGVYVYKMTEN